MAGLPPTASGRKARKRRPIKPLRVLVVDRQPDIGASLAGRVGEYQIEMVQVSSLAEARQHLSAFPVDVALIDDEQPDGCGANLVDELSRRVDGTLSIVVSAQPTMDGSVRAIRAGAIDYIAKPIEAQELTRRLEHAGQRHQLQYERRRRLRRLRRVCKKLNRMRNDIRQQVDILCQDLVAAYQELAVQMNQVVQTSEFAGVIRQELDLEQLLRKTLEYLLQKVGPTNAAIFLPAGSDEYTLGGYVNYDCTSDSAEVLLQHLADVVAPRVAERGGPIHITDSATLAAWIGSDMALLTDSHMVAFTCWHEQEPLAVVILFRHESDTYDPGILEMSESIAPMLGEFLAKLIRIHHRHLDIEDGPEEDDGDFTWGNAA